jgi:hypothetical protein
VARANEIGRIGQQSPSQFARCRAGVADHSAVEAAVEIFSDLWGG